MMQNGGARAILKSSGSRRTLSRIESTVSRRCIAAYAAYMGAMLAREIVSSLQLEDLRLPHDST